MKILLASRSARRRDILKMFGVPFRVSAPDAEEVYTGDPGPEELVTGLACRKARAALPLALPEECIVAADTVVVSGGRILGKPADRTDAFRMLRLLSAIRCLQVLPFCTAAHSVSGAAKQTSGSGSCPRRKFHRMLKQENRLTRPADTAFRSAARYLSTE